MTAHSVEIDDKVFWLDKQVDVFPVSGVVINVSNVGQIMIIRDDNDKIHKMHMNDLIAEYDSECKICVNEGIHALNQLHTWIVHE